MTVKNWAKILLELSEDSYGNLDAQRIDAVCEIATQNFPEIFKLKVLREFKRISEIKLARSKSEISTAAELSEDLKSALINFVRSKNEHAQIEFNQDSKLLAGLKISVGDTVWENSARLRLAELAKSLNA